MPNPDEPVIEDWVDHLSKVVGVLDGETFFVGHSVGCQTILRYLATQAQQVGGVVCVGGWFQVRVETEEEKRIARPWEEIPIDVASIRAHIKHCTAIFSDNDPFVPLEYHKQLFEKQLGAEIVVESGLGHLGGEGKDLRELPSVLRALERML